LNSFFSPTEEDNGDFEDEKFGLDGIPEEILEQATEIALFMQAIDWKWDIVTVLEQPYELFQAVMKITVAGQKIKKQIEKQKKATDNA